MIPKIKTYYNKYGNPNFSFIAIIILTGSIFENNQERGISHFIEHLLFKGSKYSKNLKNLNNKLNSSGMIVNAFTTPFITCFHLSCPNKYIEEAINTLVQMIFNPLFREEDINKERRVVINELMEKTNNPQALASIQAQQTMYTENNPLHHPVIGYADILLNIDRDTILTYYHKFYQPKNMIFFSNTSKNKNSIKKLWENAFHKYSNLSINSNNIPSTFQIFQSLKPNLISTGEEGTFHISKHFPNNTTVHVLIIYIIPDITPKQEAAFNIFSNYLAGGLSSRLFTKLRNEEQLIYSVLSEIEPNIDSNNFIIQFNCKKDKTIFEKCMKIINHTIKDIIKNGIPIHEFKKFKNKSIINYQRISSSGMLKLNELIDKYLFNLPKNNYKKNLQSITNSYLHNTISDKFKNKNTKKFVFTV